ncbi:MAG: hypothetical protein AB7J19_15155, partial [Beijerinckiaceae bacterium]
LWFDCAPVVTIMQPSCTVVRDKKYLSLQAEVPPTSAYAATTLKNPATSAVNSVGFFVVHYLLFAARSDGAP